jgi:hypothetical protein
MSRSGYAKHSRVLQIQQKPEFRSLHLHRLQFPDSLYVAA